MGREEDVAEAVVKKAKLDAALAQLEPAAVDVDPMVALASLAITLKRQIDTARPRVIGFGDFILRWTDPEYALLLQKRATAVTAGNVALIKMWDVCLARGEVDLDNPMTATFKATMVSNAILTQARADVIFT